MSVKGIVVLSLFRLSQPAWAHGTAIEYRPTTGFEVLARYDDGTPMAEAQVAVFAPDNPREPHSRALTDAQGRFWFYPPTPGNWEVQVRQAGHGSVVTIAVGDVGATTAPVVSSAYSPLQVALMMAAVVWGCVGTALYFRRRDAST